MQIITSRRAVNTCRITNQPFHEALMRVVHMRTGLMFLFDSVRPSCGAFKLLHAFLLSCTQALNPTRTQEVCLPTLFHILPFAILLNWLRSYLFFFPFCRLCCYGRRRGVRARYFILKIDHIYHAISCV